MLAWSSASRIISLSSPTRNPSLSCIPCHMPSDLSNWGKKAFLKASHTSSSSDLLSSALCSPASWGGTSLSHGVTNNHLNSSKVTPSLFSKTQIWVFVYVCVQCVQAHAHEPNPLLLLPWEERIVSGPVIIEMAKIMPWYDSKCDLEEKCFKK